MKQVLIGLALTILIIVYVTLANRPKPEGTIWIGAGPQGGTLVVFAEGLAELLQDTFPDLEINLIGSGGSVANLQSIEAEKLDLAWGYAGDIYLGYQGELLDNVPPFANVYVLGRVFGSVAHLLVPAESVVKSPYDLINRRVAIGCSGSGSAHTAERYFRSIGIWDKIIPLYMGYELGIEELIKGRAEAIWQLVGWPSPSITALSQKQPIRLINLYNAAQSNDFFTKFPYYTSAVIPVGTYPGVNEDISSYADNTLLVTHKDVDPQLIGEILKVLFSADGIAHMRKKHPMAQDLDPAQGLKGVLTPLHPEAAEFWNWKPR